MLVLITNAPTDSPLRQGFVEVAGRLRTRQQGVRGAFQKIYATRKESR